MKKTVGPGSAGAGWGESPEAGTEARHLPRERPGSSCADQPGSVSSCARQALSTAWFNAQSVCVVLMPLSSIIPASGILFSPILEGTLRDESLFNNFFKVEIGLLCLPVGNKGCWVGGLAFTTVRAVSSARLLPLSTSESPSGAPCSE